MMTTGATLGIIMNWAQMPARRDRGALRCVAVFVAALCLFSQLSHVAHMILVRHATCAEHGELIHVDEGRSVAAEHQGFVHDEATSSYSVTATTPAEAQSHDHDPCYVLSQRESASLPPADAVVPTGARMPSMLLGEGSLQAPSASALYWLAPKNSPPA